MLNNCLSEGLKICKDLESKLYSQFENSFLSCVKVIFVFTNDIILNFLKNRRNMSKMMTIIKISSKAILRNIFVRVELMMYGNMMMMHVTRVRETGEVSPVFYKKLEKSVLILGRNALIAAISGLNFPFKMQFVRVPSRKNQTFFRPRPFFLVL